MKVALSSFQEVINRLCQGTQNDVRSQEVIQGIDKVKLFNLQNTLMLNVTYCTKEASTISIKIR